MKYQITVPNVDDFDLVEVSEILVAVGDNVKTDDSVITLESEKAAMEIPAPKSGKVDEIHAKVGDTVQTNTLLITLDIGQDVEDAEVARPAAVAPIKSTVQHQPTDKEAVKEERASSHPTAEDNTLALRASPSVRRFARELGVKLSAVVGTGPKGRITREDVAQFFRTLTSTTSQTSPPRSVDYRTFGDTHIEDINNIQRASAKHLQQAWQAIPHVCQHGEADVEALKDYRKQLNDTDNRRKLTLLPFLIKALALTLKEFPNFNASLESTKTLLIRDYYHIGFAVDTENGLLVPVIRDADKKSIETIADEILKLAQRARDAKLSGDDMAGSCMTVSNLGSLDSGAFTPIINAPEAAILGVSRICIKAVWDGKQFIPRSMLPLHLSYDHRLNNGVAAVHFLNHYIELLSKPKTFA